MSQAATHAQVKSAIEIAVYLILIFAILSWCLQILMPFVSFLAWGSIIAVAMHKPYLKLRDRLGGSDKLAVSVFVILGLAVILIPTWMFGGSLIDSLQQFRADLQSGDFSVAPANESVSNLEAFLENHHEQLRQIMTGLLSKAASVGLSVLQFVAATLIAAAFLANEGAMRAMASRFFARLVGDNAANMIQLTSATIRSVAVGVLGIALIQAVLLGGGMLVVGVPAAGLLALVVFIIVTAQLPALLVMAPVIAWVFSAESTTTALIFAVYAVLASMSDIVLKPLMLGRGVEAPMLVILLGAIGGMVTSGIIGLFLGAVILALGYMLLEAWMKQGFGSADVESMEPSQPEA
jgi:predicted PurR-regulated permease PerM